MTALGLPSLCDPVLIDCDVEHGFGQRGSQLPDSTVFPRQVHGVEIFESRASSALGEAPEADVILTRQLGIPVGIVTADCVPVLLAAVDGSAVAAIHAGWRGLAAGVVEAGVHALRERATGSIPLVAAVGPAARRCCYEVDQPVLDGLSLRYARDLDDSLSPGRPGRFQLDLPTLTAEILAKNGVARHRIGMSNCLCTICSGPRFESFRRDGSRAGRLKHFISRPGSLRGQG